MSGYIRQKEILAILGKKSDVSVTELCERLFVSAPTIRRDLQFLEKEGLIRRTHGGAALLRGGGVGIALRHSIRGEQGSQGTAGGAGPGVYLRRDDAVSGFQLHSAAAGKTVRGIPGADGDHQRHSDGGGFKRLSPADRVHHRRTGAAPFQVLYRDGCLRFYPEPLCGLCVFFQSGGQRGKWRYGGK